MEERFVAEVHPLDIRAHSGVALKRKEVRERNISSRQSFKSYSAHISICIRLTSGLLSQCAWDMTVSVLKLGQPWAHWDDYPAVTGKLPMFF